MRFRPSTHRLRAFADLFGGATFWLASALLSAGTLAQEPAAPPAAPPTAVAEPAPGAYAPELLDADFAPPEAVSEGCDTVGAMAHIRRKVFGMDDCGAWTPNWYVQVDAMWLDRSRGDRVRLIEDQNGAGPIGSRPTLLTTDGLDYDTAWGPRITLACQSGCQQHCEITYYGLQHWSTEETLTSTTTPFNLSIPFDETIDSNFDGVEQFRTSQSSDLHNLELNHFNDDCCLCLKPMYGLRYFNLRDEIDLHLYEGDGRVGRYEVDADNHLVGFQVGAVFDRWVTPRLSWNLIGKAGGFVNFTRQSTYLAAEQDTLVYRDFTDHDEELAFVGEVGVNLTYHLTRCLALTAGYQLLWVDGLALAPEQLDYTNTPTSGTRVDADGDLFFNGGYVGIRFTH